MRLLVLALLVAACDSDGRSPADARLVDALEIDARVETMSCDFEGRTYPANVTWRWECNSCTCKQGQPACTLIECGSPNGDAGDACDPEGACANGPRCGSECCGPGERCNGWVCVCGEASLSCGPLQACSLGTGTCGEGCVDLEPPRATSANR